MPGRPSSISVRRAVVLSVAATALLACGRTSDDERRQRLADDLIEETDGALDDDRAECVADSLYDEFGDESFDRVLEAAAAGEDADEDVRVQVIDIFAGCEALDPIIDDGT